MDFELHSPSNQEISDEEWQGTPSSVKRFLVDLMGRLSEVEQQVAALAEENRALKEQAGSNSQNSSKPPSSDPPNAPLRQLRKPSGKKRGGQRGHQGHRRKLIAVEKCQKVEDCYPQKCGKCSNELEGEDA